MRIHYLAHFAALREARVIDAFGQAQVAHAEILIGGIATEREWPVSRPEVTGAGEGGGHVWNTNVRRKFAARTKFVRNHTPDAGILDGGARAVAGEHVMRAAVVIGLPVRHGTD